jgi:hypothetical protein
MIQTTLKWVVVTVAAIIGIISMGVIGEKDKPLVGFKDYAAPVVVGILLGFLSFFVIGIVTQGVATFIPSYNKKMLDYKLSQMSAIEQQIEVETDVDQRDWLLNQHYKYHKEANGYRRVLRVSNLKTFESQDWKYQEEE